MKENQELEDAAHEQANWEQGSKFPEGTRPKVKYHLQKDSFKAGAKWQAERSYSEEEFRRLTFSAFNYGFNLGLKVHNNQGTIDSFSRWFEQNKKK